MHFFFNYKKNVVQVVMKNFPTKVVVDNTLLFLLNL